MINIAKILFLYLFLTLNPLMVISQEFMQSFLYPQINNPAFTQNNYCSEIIIANTYHNIAPNLSFTKNMLDANISIPEINSGFQFRTIIKQSPQNVFSNYNFSFAYVYSIKLNRNKKINLAIEAEYQDERFNNSTLIFPSMIDVWGSVVANSSTLISNYSLKNLFFNSGVLFQTNKYFFGLSMKNIYAFYFEQKFESPYYFNFSFRKQEIFKNEYFFVNYYFDFYTDIKQRNKINNGIEINYSNLQSGIFISENLYEKKISNNILLFFGVTYNKLKIIYSYEFNIGNLFLNKSSLHELSLKYQINCKEKNKKHTIICPAYKL